MRTCKDEKGAKRYPDVHAAIDAADSYNEWKSPHIFGRMAQVMSGGGVYTVGVFTTDTKVLTGFLTEQLAAARPASAADRRRLSGWKP